MTIILFGNTTKICMIASFTLDWLCAVTHRADLLWPFNKMSKRKISSYLGGEINEETEKDKDQNDLRIEVGEGDGNTNPKVVKTSNESHNFQSKRLKEHTWLRYENQAMFCHFCRLGKKNNSNQASREHQDATMEAWLWQTFAIKIKKFVPQLFPSVPFQRPWRDKLSPKDAELAQTLVTCI